MASRKKVDTQYLRKQLAAYQETPTNSELFHELWEVVSGHKSLLREKAKIATLRAKATKGSEAAAAWYEAASAFSSLGDPKLYQKYLLTALRIDPSNDAIVDAAGSLFLETKRYSDAAAVMRKQLEAWKNSGYKAVGEEPELVKLTAAARHEELAYLYDEHLSRFDLAIVHFELAWNLDPTRRDALRRAREIHAQAGNIVDVVRLYEQEIEYLQGQGDEWREDRFSLELALGKFLKDHGDEQTAIFHLEEAAEISPENLAAKQTLAEVYETREKESLGDEDQGKAGLLFLSLAETDVKRKDFDSAFRYLDRAFSALGSWSSSVIPLLESFRSDGRFEQTAKLCKKALSLIDKDHPDRKSLLEQLESDMAEIAPLSDERKQYLFEITQDASLDSPRSQMLLELCEETRDFETAASLYSRLLSDAATTDDIKHLLRLVTLYEDHLGKPDKAAECLHKILEIDPSNHDAYAKYQEHFRKRRDWHGLAQLLEFSFSYRRKNGAPAEELVTVLEQLAELNERRLGDVDRALKIWKKIQSLQDTEAAVAAIKRLSSRTKMWEQLLRVLEAEAAAAKTDAQRISALHRIAQVFRERNLHPERTIQIYEEIASLDPLDGAALVALYELYERNGSFTGMTSAIRRQLVQELAVARQSVGNSAIGINDLSSDYQNKTLHKLRKLADLYEKELADADGVSFACGRIIELRPKDRDALEQMERVFEKTGDVQRLEKTLKYHASIATGPEQAKLYRRLANIPCTDPNENIERWEYVLEAAPGDSKTLLKLAKNYDEVENYSRKAACLEKYLAIPAPLVSEDHIEIQRDYARTVGLKLANDPRALQAWRDLRQSCPTEIETLEALSTLLSREQDTEELIGVFNDISSAYAEKGSNEIASGFSERAVQLMEETDSSPSDIILGLKRIISLNPKEESSYKKLWAILLENESYQDAARIIESLLFISDVPETLEKYGKELAATYAEKLNDNQRAIHTYERVLQTHSQNKSCLRAVAELYANNSDWTSQNTSLEKLLSLVESPEEKGSIMARLARTCDEEMDAPEQAFNWYTAIFEGSAKTEDFNTLIEYGTSRELWDKTLEAYENRRVFLCEAKELSIPEKNQLESITLSLSKFQEEHTSHTVAFETIKNTLSTLPQNHALLKRAKELAATHPNEKYWPAILTLLDVFPPETDSLEKALVAIEQAELSLEKVDDPSGAQTYLLRAYGLAPFDETSLDNIRHISDQAKDWSALLAIEASRYALAQGETKLSVLLRIADLYEHNIDDKVKAYRTYIQLILLKPENNETRSHLERLCEEIQEYTEEEATPHSWITPAEITTPQQAPSRPSTNIHSQSTILKNVSSPLREAKNKESTLELDIDEMQPMKGSPTLPLPPTSTPSPKAPYRGDPTLEVAVEDLFDVLKPSSLATPPLPPKPIHSRPKRKTGAPPLPPKPKPEFKRSHRAFSEEDVSPKEKQPPSLPIRKYEGPWHELATAYEFIANNEGHRFSFLLHAAKIWENGAHLPKKAFRAYSLALRDNADNSNTRKQLKRIAKENDYWPELTKLYESISNSVQSTSSAVELLSDLAEIKEKQGDVAEAETLHRKILRIDPTKNTSRQSIDDLFRNDGRWVDLAASLEEQTDDRLSAHLGNTDRIPLLKELATIYEDKLDRPRDQIETLERLLTVTPGDIPTLQQLSVVYEELHLWNDLLRVYERLVLSTENEQEKRDVLFQSTLIYRDRLKDTQSALQKIRIVLDTWPHDEEAHTVALPLAEEHGHWQLIQNIFLHRANNAKDHEEKLTNIAQAAEIATTQFSAPHAAIDILDRVTKHNESTAILKADALCKTGEVDTALSFLLSVREKLISQKANQQAIARVIAEEARVHAQETEDMKEARKLAEEALRFDKQQSLALLILAQSADATEEPELYAQAQKRAADAASDPDEKIAMLINAAMTYRDKCKNTDKARSLLDEILTMRPYHGGANWAMAGLVEKSGDIEEAAVYLEKRLQAADISQSERQQTMMQLATLSQEAGILPASEKYIQDAINLDPSHLPAVLAKIEILTCQERQEDIVAFLEEYTTKHADQLAPGARAEILRRLASAQENVGRLEKAYQTLLVAERTDRGNILSKIALGKNRITAKRWREAVLHLSTITKHKECENYPKETGHALFLAAQAEEHIGRPAKATELYKESLRLYPAHAGSLEHVSDELIQKGRYEEAVSLLNNQLANIDPPSAHRKLRGKIAGLLTKTNLSPAEILTFFMSTIEKMNVPQKEDLPLLKQFIDEKNFVAPLSALGKAHECIALLEETPSTKAQHHALASGYYWDMADIKSALRQAKKALYLDETHQEAIITVSEVYMLHERFDKALACLEKHTSHLDILDIKTEGEALLWKLQGTALARSGNDEGWDILRHVASSKKEASLLALQELCKKWENDPDNSSALVDARRRIAKHTLSHNDIKAYVNLISKMSGPEPRPLLQLAQKNSEAPPETFDLPLKGDINETLFEGEQESPVFSLCSLLWEAAPILWKDTSQALFRREIGSGTTVSKNEEHVFTLYNSLSSVTPYAKPYLYRMEAKDAEEFPDSFAVVCSSPAIIVLGPEFFSGELSDRDILFRMGQALYMSSPGCLPYFGHTAADWSDIFEAITSHFSEHPNDIGSQNIVGTFIAKLPVRVRSQLKDLLQKHALTQSDVRAYQKKCQENAVCLGILLANDLTPAKMRYTDEKRYEKAWKTFLLNQHYLATWRDLAFSERTKR